MSPWILPAVKAILPHVSTIITAAAPVFKTRKIDEEAATQAGLLQQQITELQSAVSQNDGHIKELAEQLKNTVSSLEQGAMTAEARFTRTTTLCALTMAMSAVAIGTSLFAVFGD